MEKKVLATVGEKEITNLDVESALKSLDPYQAMHFQTEEGKKQLLEDLVNQELFYMQAKENQLHNDEAFKSEIPYFEDITVIPFSAETGECVEDVRAIIEDVALGDEE